MFRHPPLRASERDQPGDPDLHCAADQQNSRPRPPSPKALEAAFSWRRPCGVMRISVLLAGRLSGRIGNAIPAACIILNRRATKTCELRGMSSSRARRAGLFCRLACAAGNSKLSRRFPRAATTAPVPTAQLSGGAGANPLGRWVEVSGVHNLQDGKRD